MDYNRLKIIVFLQLCVYTVMNINLNFEFVSHTNYNARCFSKEITFDTQKLPNERNTYMHNTL